MPLTRYQIRNEYSLADPELYRAADKDDPEALLEGVAMAGLVGVLRQLGDLAEFAAEIFHDLHEEVMATAARGHGLMVRVQQLEAEFPSIEKAFLSQTSLSAFFGNSGIDWHPNLRMNQNLITREDLPRCIMDSYEECRGPPRLFLLDKFDVAGAGACLKRYTDPSFYKVEGSSCGMASTEVQREKKTRKTKKKGSRWRNGETPECLPTSHAKLHQLFLEERVQNGVSDPARLVKLKRRLNGFPFDSKTGKSYMEKFLKTSSPEDKLVHEISISSSPLKLPSNIPRESGRELLEISTVSSGRDLVQRKSSPCSSPNMDELCEELTDGGILKVPQPNVNFEAGNISSTLHKVLDEKEISVEGESKTDGSRDGYQSDDIASEIDDYMDALTTMESEIETDIQFRAKNDLGFSNIEKQGRDSDANEERLQAQFSDSQSIGNSTASDDGNCSSKKGISTFSYSDMASSSAENSSLGGGVSAKVFQSTEIYEAEITDVSSKQMSVIKELPVIQRPEYEVSNGVCSEVPEISSNRSEFGEPSSNICLTDSFPVPLLVDPRSIVTEDTLGRPELDEISSNHNELDTEFINTEEKGTNLDDNLYSTSEFSDVPSQTRDDIPPTAFAENHHKDTLDVDDPSISFNASIHFSTSLEAATEKRSSENPLDGLLQTEYADDSSTKNLVDDQISSPLSVISHAEEKPFVPALLESETCDPDEKPAGIVPVDDAIPSSREIAATLIPAVYSPDTCITKQQVSEITDDAPPLEFDSTEVGVSCSQERDLDGALSTTDCEEMGRITPNINVVGSGISTLESPSDILNSPGPASPTEVQVHLEERVTETIQSEAVVVAAAFSGHENDSSEDGVNSLSITSRKLQEECHSSLEASDQNGLEINNTCLSQNKDLGTQKEVDSKSFNSRDSESVMCNTVPCHHSNSELLDDIPGSSLTSEADDIPASSLTSEAEEVDSKSVNSQDLDSVMCNTVSCDHSNSELLDDIPGSSLTSEAEQSSYLDDATTVRSSSKHSGQDRESKSPQQNNLFENTEDTLSSVAKPRIPLEENVEVQVDQLDVELMHTREESSELFSQVENIQSPNHMDHERHFYAYSESFPVHLPSQPLEQKVEVLADQPDVGSLHKASSGSSSQFEKLQSPNHMDLERRFDASSVSSSVHLQTETSVSELLPQSGSHKLDFSKQATDPLSSVFPGFSLLPQVTEVNLEEMPPLPPLPPVQWRIGKLQHSSLPSERDAVQSNVEHFTPMLPSKAEEETQMGYPALEGNIIQPSNPFFPLSAVEDENSQRVYQHSASNIEHSSPFLLQMPTMSNNVNSQDYFLNLGRTQSVNPFLTLPAYNERPQESLHAKGGPKQRSFHPFAPPPTIGDTTSTYASGSLHEKLIQTLHQLPPEASVEIEKLEHTSVISEVNVVNPPNRNISPTTIEDEQLQNVSETSEGEVLMSSSMSTLFPDFEDGKPNGNRPMKLPRPRSPLIDAVAAHDKSKLRKVTERVRPQMQKVDERDSLLEQIRAKSFNLKPALATRPSIQGPTTNLKVAAILEKANSIRQALAGSDEDDDADWSDS